MISDPLAECSLRYILEVHANLCLNDHLSVAVQCPHLDAAPVLGPGHPALVSAGVGPALWTVHNQVISRQSWTGTSGNIRYYDPVCNICFSSLSHVFPCGFLKVLKVIIDERLLINCQNKYHNILNSKM